MSICSRLRWVFEGGFCFFIIGVFRVQKLSLSVQRILRNIEQFPFKHAVLCRKKIKSDTGRLLLTSGAAFRKEDTMK